VENYRVTLTREERVGSEGLIGAGKAAARKLAHARVLLLADDSQGEPRDDDAIASALSLGSRTASRVRKRFVTEGLDAALDHRPQPPRPDEVKVEGDVQQALVRIACGDPPEGRSHWTLPLLADEPVTRGLAEKLSTQTARQALKETTSTRGWCGVGVCRPRPTPGTSGAWGA
jgi:hypothetical protein